MTSDRARETCVGNEYMLSRGFRASARLHLQHWILKQHCGYVLHPTISNTVAACTVADIGTGNGCWLLDLAQEVPSAWILEGFDVSSEQFPTKENLPTNVTLAVQDAFDEVPDRLRGRFDIVHIRAFAGVIKNGDPTPLLQNLIKMIKPGGHLQWDEFDSGNFYAHSTLPTTVKSDTEELVRVWHKLRENLSIRVPWMGPGAMLKYFEEHDLSVVNDTMIDRWDGPEQLTPILRKAYTDNWMMALEEVGFTIYGRAGSPVSPVTSQEFATLLDKAVKETSNGVNLWMDMQVVVGKKALS